MKQMETPEEKRARRLAKKVCVLFILMSIPNFKCSEENTQRVHVLYATKSSTEQTCFELQIFRRQSRNCFDFLGFLIFQEAKERKRKANMGWDDEYMVSLLETFVQNNFCCLQYQQTSI